MLKIDQDRLDVATLIVVVGPADMGEVTYEWSSDLQPWEVAALLESIVVSIRAED